MTAYYFATSLTLPSCHVLGDDKVQHNKYAVLLIQGAANLWIGCPTLFKEPFNCDNAKTYGIAMFKSNFATLSIKVFNLPRSSGFSVLGQILSYFKQNCELLFG